MLNSALHGHLDGRWKDAVQLLEEAHSSRASANTAGERALRSFARARHWLRALSSPWAGVGDRSFGEVVKALPTWWLTLHYITACGGGNLITCTTSIRKCGTSWQQATNLLQSLQFSRIRLDNQVHGAALVSLVSGVSWQPAVQLVEEMTCVALEKNVIIRSELMRARPSEWWKSVELEGADLVCFSTLIDALEKVGAWIRASTVLARLSTDGLRLDQVLLNSCCSVAQKAAVWRESLQLLRRSEALQLKPNLLTYSASISAAGAAASRPWKEALHIGQRARQTLRSLDTVSHNAMISAVEKVKFRWPRAFLMYSNLRRPSTVTCNALLSACENARAWERAFVTVDILQAMGLKPQLMTFNAAISSCQGSPWPRALKLLEELTQRQFFPDEVTIDALGLVCKNAWQQAMYVTTGSLCSAGVVRTAVAAREQGHADALGSVRLMSELWDLSKFSTLP